ncbi:hypothetical protein ACOYR1_18075 [Thalassotalea piscium]
MSLINKALVTLSLVAILSFNLASASDKVANLSKVNDSEQLFKQLLEMDWQRQLNDSPEYVTYLGMSNDELNKTIEEFNGVTFT